MKKYPILLSLMLLSACSSSLVDSGDDKQESKNMNFYQHWVHSYEEQNGAKTPSIFRLAGSKNFPPSRSRMEFGFDPNGQCNYSYVSPDDHHEMRSCIYTKIGNEVYIYDNKGVFLPHLSFTLLEPAGKDLMRISYGIKSKKTAGKNVKPKS